MKLTKEQKIELYQKSKQGISVLNLSKEYGIRHSGIKYLIRLIDLHGIEILRENENRHYSPELKLEIINKVLIQNQPIWTTSLEYGLPGDGTLHSWINRYKADGYVIIEKKKGKPPTMNKESKPIKALEEMTPEEKNKYYEERLLYLEAENEYLKKLHAVVQARKNRQQKKK